MIGNVSRTVVMSITLIASHKGQRRKKKIKKKCVPFSCRALRSKIEIKQRNEAAAHDLLWAKMHSKRMSREKFKSVSDKLLRPLRLLLSTRVSKFRCKRWSKKYYKQCNIRNDACGKCEPEASSLSKQGAATTTNKKQDTVSDEQK